MDYLEGIKYHKELHANKDTFAGYSVAAHIPNIANIIKDSNIKTLLDYGCGKALGWKNNNYHYIIGLERKNIFLFDPCVDEYSLDPKPADLVICIDVMEHIPENYVDDVLRKIFSLAKKSVYFAISHRPANKFFSNGVNAHLTIKPEEWWAQKIKPYSENVLVKGIKFE